MFLAPSVPPCVSPLPGNYSKNSRLETTMSTQALPAKTAGSKPPWNTWCFFETAAVLTWWLGHGNTCSILSMERNKSLHGMISMNYGNNKQQTSRLHHHYPSLVGQKMVMKSHESPMFISFGSSKNRRSDLGPFRPGTSPWPLKIQACGWRVFEKWRNTWT